MSPKGVEHIIRSGSRVMSISVHSSMSPKGVEHSRKKMTAYRYDSAFINVAERR